MRASIYQISAKWLFLCVFMIGFGCGVIFQVMYPGFGEVVAGLLRAILLMIVSAITPSV